MARYLQEPSKNGAGRVIASAVEMCELAGRIPAVWEYVSESSWESGQPRVTSTLMIFVEDGLTKLCLHDRACMRTAWVSGRSLTAALEALEEAAARGSLEWRKDRVDKRR